MKVRPGDLWGPAGLGLFMVAVQLIALLIAQPLDQSHMSAFQNPADFNNIIIYVVLIVVYAGIVLLLIKYKLRWLIKAIVTIAVFSTLVYVFVGVSTIFYDGLLDHLDLISADLLLLADVALAVVLTALMLVYPEWYVVDVVGVVTAAGAAALFGISLNILPTILLLVVLIVYDYVAVYKTKHMLTLAQGVTDLNLPVLFVLPLKLNYSYIRKKAPIRELKEGERETFIMGLGDTVMPTILAVSANVFVDTPRLLGFVNLAALGTIVGTLVSHAVLMYYVLKGKPLAGLPFLCTGAIVGFLAGWLLSGLPPLH